MQKTRPQLNPPRGNQQLWFIIAAAAVAFIPVLKATYLPNWDDGPQVLDNLAVHAFTWTNLKTMFTTDVAWSYQPLASLTFAVEYLFFGANPTVSHFNNYLLHLLNVFLVFQLVTCLFPVRKRLAIFTTAVFALNPIQTEVVAWISTRSTLMVTALSLFACWRYAMYVKDHRKNDLALCVGAFGLALFCKTSAITLPVALILIDLTLIRVGLPGTLWTSLFNSIFKKIPLLIFSGAFWWVGLYSRHVLKDHTSDYEAYFSVFERLCIICHSYLFYVFKAVLPYPLYNFHDYPLKLHQPSLPAEYPLAFIAVLALGGALIALTVRHRIRTDRPEFLGFLFFSINIIPILNFVNFSPTMVAERYDYLAIVGLALVFVSVMEQGIEHWQLKRHLRWVAPAILAAYMILTFHQSQVWESEKTLWGHAVEYSKGTYPFVQYAKFLRASNDLKQSLYYYNEAVKLNPYDQDIYRNRGFLILDLGDYAYAQKDFTRVIDLPQAPVGARAWSYYGRARARMGLNDYDLASKDLQAAIELSPNSEFYQFQSEMKARRPASAPLKVDSPKTF